ncbi:MAG: Tol-Pal system beta propeller repeat protein TolB [Spongiibacteraceae bacterium]|jgi:TolB protein|nr:Tol-Pal system beta propeller repeat protein TolB [Spongiibacteraceae bacterium]
MLLANASWAQLTIQITQGRDNATPIAVVPFGWNGTGQLSEDVAAIIAADLQRSGLFAPMDRRDMLSLPTQGSEVVYQDWRALKVDYLLIGRMVPFQNGYTAQYELFDVLNQRPLLTGHEQGYRDSLREVAHRIADRVYEQLTGIRGAFNTRLLYVSRLRDASGQYTYRLLMADADGAREQVLRTQREPLMSPSWSPDAQSIAYVSFETGRPAIYIENLRTRQRQQITNFSGLNSSPVWSPDGRRMAMVLSKDGNPEVYVMDLATRELTRITNHFAIDTEPSWTPDGRSLLFTSDRGGRPQIYRATLGSNKVERVSFEGDYNARARMLPDASGMVMVHRAYGNFNIALQLLNRRYFQVLTKTQLDESPSIAPNGAMLIYATLHQGRTILAAVSIDGGTRYLLPSRFGDVREPAWSPFLDRR